jgi:hypothetical protein
VVAEVEGERGCGAPNLCGSRAVGVRALVVNWSSRTVRG